ncbi:hypothetical protein CAP39_11885 [Sphingomonas sp. IBVSS1]|nr:hypothetical protein CAP39_11885 [Sphingomonas sp. IBVSS1]
MKRILALLAGAGLITAIAVAQQASPKAEVPPPDASGGGGSAYAVGGIAVDVTAKNVDDARRIAWSRAQRLAWPQLWARLTGRPALEAPALSDGQIDAMVAGIESQGEQFSATRYIAKLGVVFDRSRAADYVGGGLALLQSPPMLLLPIEVDGGAALVMQARTPWAEAWARWRGNVTPIDYVLPGGGAADNLWLNAWQAGRPERGPWRSIMARFDTVDVLVAEVRLIRSFPGGPVKGQFIARHGPDGVELGRFALTVKSENALPALMDEGVRRIDAIYAEALRAGRLQAERDLGIDMAPVVEAEPLIGDPMADAGALLVAAITPDAAALAGAENLLRAVSGGEVLVRQSAVGGTSRFELAMPGGEAALQAALAAKGWTLVANGNDRVLRRAAPAAAPQPAPPAPKPPPATKP